MAAGLAALVSVGCRSFGRLPGIDPADYAYSYFHGEASQVYQFTAAQVESSALEALADLGFRGIEYEREDGCLKIRAKTLDHRPSWVTVRPRNAMSEMSVRIGSEGDELVSEALIQRVALNLGSMARTLIPLEPTLGRRINPLTLPRPESPAPEVPLLVPSDPKTVTPTPPTGRGPFAPDDGAEPEPAPPVPSLPEPLTPEMPLLPLLDDPAGDPGPGRSRRVRL